VLLSELYDGKFCSGVSAIDLLDVGCAYCFVVFIENAIASVRYELDEIIKIGTLIIPTVFIFICILEHLLVHGHEERGVELEWSLVKRTVSVALGDK